MPIATVTEEVSVKAEQEPQEASDFKGADVNVSGKIMLVPNGQEASN